MDITKIPYHKFLGLQRSDDNKFVLKLPEKEDYLNHLGTVHASVLFALAESTLLEAIALACDIHIWRNSEGAWFVFRLRNL